MINKYLLKPALLSSFIFAGCYTGMFNLSANDNATTSSTKKIAEKKIDSPANSNSQNSKEKLIIEAEDYFKTITDVGENGKVDVDSAELASENAFVALYDLGDCAQIKFNIPQNGNYKIAVRVRSGSKSDKKSYFENNVYSFKIDGKTVSLVGVEKTISKFDSSGGGFFWGEMILPTIELSKGKHNIEIKIINNDWGAVDVLYVTPTGK